MRFVVSERCVGRVGLAVGAVLVLAACAAGGGDAASAGWPGAAKSAYGPGPTEAVDSGNAVSTVNSVNSVSTVRAVSAAFGKAVGTSATGPGPVAEVRQAGAPATTLSITEGEVGEVGPHGTITYPSVTSCLVVTVYLRDGGKVGGHVSLFQVPGKYYSDEVLPAIKRAVGGRRVASVDVSGAVGAWNPSYLQKAIERYTDGSVPEPTGDAKAIGDAVAKILGGKRGQVTVQDVPDGDIVR
ncbi:hypothetical protein ACFVTF_03895 [Kitasatospora sp. NPDC057940]|uniref:hypothetical protein n=1 Tax=Kitasatospora sp. NPDC057940 TaxID=3346285 RepID=UPI0036D7EA08